MNPKGRRVLDNKNNKMKNKIFCSMFLLILFLVVIIPSVSAITGSIGNARMILRADVGDTIEKHVRVKNVNDIAVDIEVTASGDLEEDITIIDKEFTLEPGEEKKAYFIVNVKEEGITESKINVKFTPTDGGAGVGLSSTIIVIAGDVADTELINILSIKIDEDYIYLDPNSNDPVTTLSAGESVPIELRFIANKDTDNTKVKAYIEGHKYEISDVTDMFNMEEGEDDTKTLSLDLPDNIVTGDWTIYIRITAKNEESEEIEIPIHIDGAESLGLDIISPENSITIKGDLTTLTLKTDRNAICDYSLTKLGVPEGLEIIEEEIIPLSEMHYTGKTDHFQSITDLEETIVSNGYYEKYEIFVICTDNEEVTELERIYFYVGLSEVSEYLIREDIGDYEYLYSLWIDPEIIPDFEEVTDFYYVFYEKNIADTVFSSMVVIIEFESEEEMIEYLKSEDIEPDDFDGDSFLMMIDNGNYIIAFESDGINFYGWSNENKLIFVYSYPEEDYDGDIPFPEEIIEAYLIKYPNDLGKHFINPLSDYGKDLDNDGLYNFLTIQLNVTVPEDGEYQILGELTDEFDNKVSEIEYLPHLNKGENTIELNFNGIQIYESNKNGPYSLNRIGVVGVDNDFDLGFDDVIYITSEYIYEEFDLKTDDINPPTIQLTSPSDGYSTKTKTSTTIDFRYIPNDESEISSCSLIIDDATSHTDTSINKGIENTFSKSLSKGTYNWKIKCIDSEGNEKISETRSLIIKKKSSSGGSSRRSSSTTYITSQSTNEITENETEIQQTPEEQEVIALGNNEDIEKLGGITGAAVGIDGDINKILIVILVILAAVLIIVLVIVGKNLNP